jgi:hypothetical protein
MNPITRIPAPQRGHTSGSTSVSWTYAPPFVFTGRIERVAISEMHTLERVVV